ncbi:SDR family NAD(P)-dependent oxidoreductase [Pseudonocardia sp. TRM90224]|uniref:SDR family NAD(P)-dependent oxidoreductase n=1 Tax=Pseudonocardia sp. TRM90224 TaxID=2812678 RepID=UPI001E4A86A7|nr:glucose 1-dehydrogenase [Pseudonocardia sp. TRM90224]
MTTTSSTGDQPLSGKVALVTGASRGIGAAAAVALAAAGARVALAARDRDALDGVAERIRAAGGTALVVPTDVTDPDAVGALVERTVAEFGRLDAAFNNAGGPGHRPAPLADVAVADFDTVARTSLLGVFLSMKHEIPAMVAGGGGAIVNMASTAGVEGVAGIGGYVAGKFGVVGLSRSAALDYAAQDVRINVIAPGPILTGHLERAGEQAQQQVARSVPMRRTGLPHEVAAAVVWLCGPASSFVTGVVLPVDGGMLAGMRPYA